MALTSGQGPLSSLHGRGPAQTSAAAPDHKSCPAPGLWGRPHRGLASYHAPIPSQDWGHLHVHGSPPKPSGPSHAPNPFRGPLHAYRYLAAGPPSHSPGIPAALRALWLSRSAQGPGPGVPRRDPRGSPRCPEVISPAHYPTCPGSEELLPALAKPPAARRGQVERAGPAPSRGILGHGVLARRPGDTGKWSPGPRSSPGNVLQFSPALHPPSGSCGPDAGPVASGCSGHNRLDSAEALGRTLPGTVEECERRGRASLKPEL